MIRQLRGTLIEKAQNSIIVDVCGIGYLLAVSSTVSSVLIEGETVLLYTYLSVKEDALDLYGFIEREDLLMFEMLRSVSGIGPKSALGTLEQADRHTLTEAIIRNDATYLTRLSGIGKKTAERIVYELKDKMIGLQSRNGGNDDLMDALIALGFKEFAIRNVLKEIPTDDSMQDQIKKALQILGAK